MTGREGEMERERGREREGGRERERETVYFANLYIIVMIFFLQLVAILLLFVAGYHQTNYC